MKELVIAAAALALHTATADAQDLRLYGLGASWQNITWTGSGGSTSVDNSGGTVGLKWGTTSPQDYYGNNYQSSYSFTRRDAPGACCDNYLNIELNEGNGYFNLFRIGDFKHINYPITGKVLDYADLMIDFTLDNDGSAPRTVQTDGLRFDHLETNNPAGDLVTMLELPPSGTMFDWNGFTYILKLEGFSHSKYANSLDDLTDSFTTKESYCEEYKYKYGKKLCKDWKEKSTSGYLYASLQVVPTVTTPEPSTYAMMGIGLLAVGFVSKRRRSRK